MQVSHVRSAWAPVATALVSVVIIGAYAWVRGGHTPLEQSAGPSPIPERVVLPPLSVPPAPPAAYPPRVEIADAAWAVVLGTAEVPVTEFRDRKAVTRDATPLPDAP